ncbi:hypothetical protein [Actinomadura sp. 7K507]|nr:hypothetical protein [Actinomadura sp. 7K507]
MRQHDAKATARQEKEGLMSTHWFELEIGPVSDPGGAAAALRFSCG